MKCKGPKILLFLLVFGLITLIVPVAAHPASDLTLSYNNSTNELQVTFTHQVENPATHYIKEVDVESLGSGRILQRTYTSQPTNGTFTYTYQLAIAAGTQITVSGECNLGGEIHRTLVIGRVPTTTTTTTETMTVTETTTTATTTTVPPTTQAPGFTGLLTALALGGIALALYRHR
ncbi:MAG: hypothetical protein LUO93_07095 [Methanomicrobiales archaeon]|nr:hypothetical protein [Methanomicrobiales archaeon]